MKRFVPFLALALLLLAACANLETTAYRVVGSTAISVDTAMRFYGQEVRAGHVAPAVQSKVHDAYDRYQQAMLVAQAAVLAYRADASGNRSRLHDALAALSAASAQLDLLIRPQTTP